MPGISPGKRPPRLIYDRRPLNKELLLRAVTETSFFTRRTPIYFLLTSVFFAPFFRALFGESSNGSSSPSTGGFPLPTRSRIRLTLSESARRARSSKYSSVRMAETFSASASVISSLSATPSDSAALRASVNSVGGTRKAKLLRLINSHLRVCQLADYFHGSYHRAMETCSHTPKILVIESDDGIGPAIDTGLQDHLIIWIRQQRTSANHQLHSSCHGSKFIQHGRYIFHSGATCREGFGAG